MSLNLTKLYINERGPLKEARELEINELYVTEDGSRIRYLGREEDSMSFIIDKASPLNVGEKISELSTTRKGGLALFWKFLLKEDEDENTSN